MTATIIQLDERRRARSVARHTIGSVAAATIHAFRPAISMDDHKRMYIQQLLKERPEAWSHLTPAEQLQLLTSWKGVRP